MALITCGLWGSDAHHQYVINAVVDLQTRNGPGCAFPLTGAVSEGGQGRHRSGDLPLFRRTLYQLSYLS
jgi:hypothetical protein